MEGNDRKYLRFSASVFISTKQGAISSSTITGQKVVYSNISKDYKIEQIKECVELLQMAGLVVPVIHTAANGIPLGAESNLKKQKLMLLDTGIYLKLSGLDLTDIIAGVLCNK
jgi:predicted AAA+ superfamily ATPase